MKATNITAPLLRIILLVVLFLVTAAGIGGFIYIRGLLVQKADETAKVAAEAASSENRLSALRNAKSELDKNSNIEQKVRLMVAEAGSYHYQDQIIEDILEIGRQSEVTIKTITFSAGADSAATPATPATPTTTTTPAVVLPGGITQTTASVSIANPVRYDRWLMFVRRIEANDMNMQISKITATTAGKAENGHALISSDDFKIGIYIRNGQ